MRGDTSNSRIRSMTIDEFEQMVAAEYAWLCEQSGLKPKPIDFYEPDPESDEVIAENLFEKYYVDEFTLYSEENIMGCCKLIVRRAREALDII